MSGILKEVTTHFINDIKAQGTRLWHEIIQEANSVPIPWHITLISKIAELRANNITNKDGPKLTVFHP